MNEQIDFLKKRGILGIDESGKGDFFGPLVIAGVLADDSEVPRMKEMNIRDSKKISDGRILQLADWIKANFAHTLVVIGPEKYNQLYDKIKNLNRLLAWGHSRVIENIASEHEIEKAVSDKFGKTDLIEAALMKQGRKINLEQIVRAEAIPQVAAASILARAEFVKSMSRLEQAYGVKLHKGGGAPVDTAARAVVQKHGPEILLKISKIHFKNYQRAIG